MSDSVLLLVCLLGFAAIGLVIAKVVMPPPKKSKEKVDEEIAASVAMVAGEGGVKDGIGRMKGAARKAAKKAGAGGLAAVKAEAAAKKRAEREAQEAALRELDGGEGREVDFVNEDGTAKTKKQLAKEEAKRERQLERAAELAARDAARDAPKQLNKYELKEQEREEEEAKAVEVARQAAAAQKAKEAEEYDQWKDMFATEAAGETGAGAAGGAAQSQGLLYEFIDHCCDHKLVVLEELATQFKLQGQEVIDRVTLLDAQGRMVGLIDDRGKFLHLTAEEMANVVGYMNRRGRISIADLVRESNQLVRVEAVQSEAAAARAARREARRAARAEEKGGEGEDDDEDEEEEEEEPPMAVEVLDPADVTIELVRTGKAKKEKQAQTKYKSSLEFTRV